jgi:transcriptional regulator NrdR family protein
MSQYPCPECQADSHVIDTRPSYKRLRRRRVCLNKHKFSTYEVPFDIPKKINELVIWATENEMDADLLNYVKSQLDEIILGIKSEED